MHLLWLSLPLHSLQLDNHTTANSWLQTEEEDGPDNQLINSVYLDNSSMELYHGRLDKKPNALAIRIRSTATPDWTDMHDLYKHVISTVMNCC